MSKKKWILSVAVIMVIGSAMNASAMMGTSHGSQQGDHMNQGTYWRGQHMETGTTVHVYYTGTHYQMSTQTRGAIHGGNDPRSHFRTGYGPYHYGRRGYIGNEQTGSYHYQPEQERRHYNAK